MGIGLGFGAGPVRVYIPLSGRGRRGGSQPRAATYGVCGVNHRSSHTAGRCKDCQIISARQAAEAASRQHIEEARRAALTDEGRRSEDRAKSLQRWSEWLSAALAAGALIGMCMGSLIAVGLLAGAIAVLGYGFYVGRSLIVRKQAAVDAAAAHPEPEYVPRHHR